MSGPFPGNPKVSTVLERYISNPNESSAAEVPNVSLLEVFQKGLDNYKKHADRRVESSTEAVRVGQEVLAKARRRLEGQLSTSKAKSAYVGEDDGKKSNSKQKDPLHRAGSSAPRESDSRPKAHADRKINGHDVRSPNTSTKSPLPSLKIKRERPDSPDPSESSRQAPPHDDARLTAPLHKKKKRKHELSPEIQLRDGPGRGSSPYFDMGTERGSAPPRDREQSVRSNRIDSPSLLSSAVDLHIPSPRPPMPLSASTGAGPKIKLKLNNSKAAASGSSHATSTNQAVQQFIHPALSFSPLRPGNSIGTSQASSSRSLVPPRQPISAPAPAQPRRQKDVNQDFSTVKNVAQTVQWSTFWSGIETYIRDVGEEDVAMLTFRPDDRGIFDMPTLGRHYQDIWDEEDMQLPFSQASNSAWSASANLAPPAFQRDKERDALGNRIGKGLRRAYPKDLGEVDLGDERKGPGLLEERVVAGLWEGLPEKLSNGVGSQASARDMVVKGEPGMDEVMDVGNEHPSRNGKRMEQLGSDDPAIWPIALPQMSENGTMSRSSRLEMLNATIGETEEGVKRELRHLGLLDANEEIDWTRKEDDEIAAAIRQCQRALRDQVNSNNARKERLTGLVKDRLAYGGYEKTLEGLEKAIEGAWLKRSARKNKKQKPNQRDDGNSTRRPGEKVPLPDAVKQAMEARRRWIDVVGGAMEAPDVQGRFTGLPKHSIFDEMEDLKADATGRTWIQTASNE